MTGQRVLEDLGRMILSGGIEVVDCTGVLGPETPIIRLPPELAKDMPKVEIKHPQKTADTGSYSAGVLCDGWLYVSGHGPQDLKTGQLVEGTIEEETRLVLDHLGEVLRAAGCTYDDVVKCTVHLADLNDFQRYNKVYGEYFKGVQAARTTVQSYIGDIKIEVDCIARVPGK